MVAGQHQEIVGDAQLGEQRVDGADLNPVAPTFVAKSSRFDVVIPVRRQKRKCSEPRHDLRLRTRPSVALQKFLQHDACRKHRLTRGEGIGKANDFRHVWRGVTPQSERPDAGIYELRSPSNALPLVVEVFIPIQFANQFHELALPTAHDELLAKPFVTVALLVFWPANHQGFVG